MGFFFVEHSENGYNLKITTNNPAVFMPSEDKPAITIDASGVVVQDNDPGFINSERT